MTGSSVDPGILTVKVTNHRTITKLLQGENKRNWLEAIRKLCSENKRNGIKSDEIMLNKSYKMIEVPDALLPLASPHRHSQQAIAVTRTVRASSALTRISIACHELGRLASGNPFRSRCFPPADLSRQTSQGSRRRPRMISGGFPGIIREPHCEATRVLILNNLTSRQSSVGR